MNIDIAKLIMMYPNNQDLGRVIREAYYLGAIPQSQTDVNEIEKRNGDQINS